MSPKITNDLEKKKKMETARRKKGGEEEKQWLHPLAFMLSSLKIVFEREKNCLMEGIYFGCKVLVQKSNYRYIFFTQQLTEI